MFFLAKSGKILPFLLALPFILNFYAASAYSQGTGEINLIRAFPNLSFSAPVLLTSAKDGSNRIFVVEKSGRIQVFPNIDDTTSASVFLDISSNVSSGGEQGLLGLAFDPQYQSNGYFYIYYSRSSPRRSVISRFTVSTNPNVANTESELVLMQIDQPFSNHNGGMVEFGPDNMLYIALGDGGDGGDPLETGQDCTDLLGAILRIDPNSGTPYAVPSDNPFAGAANHSCGDHSNVPSRNCGLNGTAENQICAEVWAYGLRNPWRFSFDRSTGLLWAGDVGQGAREEVDQIRAGDNLGWDVFEGFQNFENPSNRPASDFVAPIHDYDRSSDGGRSITGGYVYRGQANSSLIGRYIYGDYVSGNIWSLEFSGANFVSNTKIADLNSVTSFGEDENGELFAVTINGTVHRFNSGDRIAPAPPRNMRPAGL